MIRAFLVLVATALSLAFGAANAHTISIGYEPAGTGSLTFWYGSYHGYDGVTELTEGTFTLVGINGNPYPTTTVAFVLHTGTKPVGLVDGVTNFYASGSSGLGVQSPLTNTNTLGLPVISWQGVTFTNLQAGDYRFTYTPQINPSAHWDSWNDTVRTSTLTISQGVLGVSTEIPTLDPAMLALLALAVAGFGWVALRRVS